MIISSSISSPVIFWAMLAVFLIVSLLHLTACWGAGRQTTLKMVQTVTKPMLMTLLLAVYLFASDLISVPVILGLGFGFIGDVSLQMPSTGKSNLGFLAGLSSFLVGHIFYIVAFIQHIPSWPPIWTLLLAGIILAAIGLAAFWSLKKSLGSMRIPAAVYLLGILTMAFFAAAHAYALHTLFAYLSMAGALLFVLSDYLLAKFTFEKPAAKGKAQGSTIHGDFWVMLTYIAGQALLVLGLAF